MIPESIVPEHALELRGVKELLSGIVCYHHDHYHGKLDVSGLIMAGICSHFGAGRFTQKEYDDFDRGLRAIIAGLEVKVDSDELLFPKILESTSFQLVPNTSEGTQKYILSEGFQLASMQFLANYRLASIAGRVSEELEKLLARSRQLTQTILYLVQAERKLVEQRLVREVCDGSCGGN